MKKLSKFLKETIESLKNDLAYFGINYLAKEHYAVESIENNLYFKLDASDVEKLNAILQKNRINRGASNYMTSRRLDLQDGEVDFNIVHVVRHDTNNYYAIFDSLSEMLQIDELLHEPEVFMQYMESNNKDLLYESELKELEYIRDKSQANYFGYDMLDHFNTVPEQIPTTIYFDGIYYEGFWTVYHEVRKEEHNREMLEDNTTLEHYIEFNNNYRTQWYIEKHQKAMKRFEEDESNNLTFEFFKKPDFIHVNGEELFIKEYKRNERTILKSGRDKYNFIGLIGSRDFASPKKVIAVLETLDPKKDIIVSGGAKGADTISAFYAQKMGFKCIIIEPFMKGLNSQQKKINNKVMKKGFVCSFNQGSYQSKDDYFKRNNLIALMSDEVHCFGLGRGSKYTVNKARSLNKQVKVY